MFHPTALEKKHKRENKRAHDRASKGSAVQTNIILLTT